MEYTSRKTRNEIWYAIWRVNTIIRYCKEHQEKYARRNYYVKLAIIIPAVSGVMNAITHLLPEIVQIILGAVVGGAAIYDVFINYGKKTSVFFIAHSQCREIEQDYHELWMDIMHNKKSNDEAVEINNRLQRRLNSVISASDSHDIDEDKEVNKRCEKEAVKAMDIRYKNFGIPTNST